MRLINGGSNVHAEYIILFSYFARLLFLRGADGNDITSTWETVDDTSLPNIPSRLRGASDEADVVTGTQRNADFLRFRDDSVFRQGERAKHHRSTLQSDGPQERQLKSSKKSLFRSQAATNAPTMSPTSIASDIPSFLPSSRPSMSLEPTAPTISPSPSDSASSSPSKTASIQPSPLASEVPSVIPSISPLPTPSRTDDPSLTSSSGPTFKLSATDTVAPSFGPTMTLSSISSALPTGNPSRAQIPSASNTPSISPSPVTPPSSLSPSNFLSPVPQDNQAQIPSDESSIGPSQSFDRTESEPPSQSPNSSVSHVPSTSPSTSAPSPLLSNQTERDNPSLAPSSAPTFRPSSVAVPTTTSDIPSVNQSSFPSSDPTLQPSIVSSDVPSLIPSDEPSRVASAAPTVADICEDFPRGVAMTGKLAAITDLAVLLNPETPQGQARDWLLIGDPANVNPCSYVTLEQRYALATFYYATHGEEWIDSTGWLLGGNECSWTNVGCTEESLLVQNLTIVNNDLNGTIPDAIRVFASMEQFDISENYISGTIPTVFGELSSSLQIFRCTRNTIIGSLPEHLQKMSSLQELSVSDNRLNGTIPTWLMSLTSLDLLYLDVNSFEGKIPSELGSSNVTLFHAQRNLLTGPLPEEVWTNTLLESLRLDLNNITGTLSDDIGDLSVLKTLNLAGNSLIGTLPLFFGRLSTLTELSLAENSLTGTIRDFFSNFVDLERLDLSANQFRGTMPSGLFELSEIHTIALNTNRLEGRIPPNFGNGISLETLSLYDNALTGQIPAIDPGDLGNLREFLIHENRFSGSMASSICELRLETLGVLDMLWADCGETASPQIQCDTRTPECCTICFPVDQRSGGDTPFDE